MVMYRQPRNTDGDKDLEDHSDIEQLEASISLLQKERANIHRQPHNHLKPTRLSIDCYETLSRSLLALAKAYEKAHNGFDATRVYYALYQLNQHPVAELKLYFINVANHLELPQSDFVSRENQLLISADDFFIKGLQFAAGIGCEQNFKQAITCYKKSINMGGKEAFFALAIAHHFGYGTVPNTPEAIRFFELSAQARNPNASYSLGCIYMHRRNSPLAIKHFKDGCLQIHFNSMFKLSKLYMSGKQVKKNTSKAIKLLDYCSQHGHAKSLYLKGVYCQNDTLGRYRIEDAIVYIKQAASMNLAKGLFGLGVLHEDRGKLTQDYDVAFMYYQKAAALGHLSAMNNLGSFYINGRGTRQDTVKAMFYYQKASDAGNSNATYNLGKIYYDGIHTETDYKKAYACFSSAAEASHKKSLLYLATLYVNGHFVTRDLKKAYTLFKEAKDYGYKPKVLIMAKSYYRGIGVQEDKKLAMILFRMAELLEEKKARQRLIQIYEQYCGEFDADMAEQFREDCHRGILYAERMLRRCYLQFKGDNDKAAIAAQYHYAQYMVRKENNSAALLLLKRLLILDHQTVFNLIFSDKLLYKKQCIAMLRFHLLERASIDVAKQDAVLFDQANFYVGMYYYDKLAECVRPNKNVFLTKTFKDRAQRYLQEVSDESEDYPQAAAALLCIRHHGKPIGKQLPNSFFQEMDNLFDKKQIEHPLFEGFNVNPS